MIWIFNTGKAKNYKGKTTKLLCALVYPYTHKHITHTHTPLFNTVKF